MPQKVMQDANELMDAVSAGVDAAFDGRTLPEDDDDRPVFIALRRYTRAKTAKRLRERGLMDVDGKAATPLTYRGVWKRDVFEAGSVVTHRSTIWHANRQTTAMPGDSSGDWTLMVKSPRK
jgi:hypothetical protein